MTIKFNVAIPADQPEGHKHYLQFSNAADVFWRLFIPMLKIPTLPVPARLSFLALLIGLFSLFLAILPASAQSVLDNPVYQEYEQMDQSLSEPPTPTPKPSPVPTPTARPAPTRALISKPANSSKEPISNSNGQIDLTPLEPQAPDQQEITLHPPTAQSRQEVEKPSLPISAVVNVQSGSLSSHEAELTSQAIWNAVHRFTQTKVQARDYSQYILGIKNMIPGERHYLAPSRSQVARALEADYLFLASASSVGSRYALELTLYIAAEDEALTSKVVISKEGLDGLLKQIPQAVEELQRSISHPGPAVIAENPSMEPEPEPSATRTSSPLALRESPKAPRPTRTPAIDGFPEELPSKPAKEPTPTIRPKRIVDGSPAPSPTARPVPVPTVLEEVPRATVNDAARREQLPKATATPTLVAPQPAATPVPTAKSTATAMPTVSPTPQPSPTPKELTNEEKAKAKYAEAQRFATTSEEGIKPLLEAVQLSPKNVEYQRSLITRLYYTHQYGECIRRGNQFMKEGSLDPMSLIFVGAAHTSLGEYSKALSALDQALKIDPKNGYALFNRALNLDLMNDPRAEEAFRYYLNVARTNPTQAQWVMEAEKKLQEIESKKTTPSTKP